MDLIGISTLFVIGIVTVLIYKTVLQNPKLTEFQRMGVLLILILGIVILTVVMITILE